ncbi:MAG: serine hydrolase domain-containing protein, partial [Gemmatimonadota bacterium]
ERVLAGLEAGLTIRGEPPVRWTLAERMAHYHVPGVSIAVVDSGRIVWARGFGVKEAGGADSVGTETVFQAGSISKPVFALGAMRLVQDGKLALDEDVNTRLTTWKVPDNKFTAIEKVTLRRLLNHTAGLTIHGFPGYPAGDPIPTIVQVLNGEKPANTAPIRVDTVPGSIVRYSGGGTTVAMVLAEDVTKKAFVPWIRETVLGPAGMKRSSYDEPIAPALAANAASGHSMEGAVVPGKHFTYPELSAAGLWTTPSDLARLAIEIQRTWEGKPPKVVSRATLEQMFTPSPLATGPDHDLPFGLGFAIGGSGRDLEFSHGGADEGFRALFVAFAGRGQAAVVMTNGQAGEPLLDEVMASIAAEYAWPSHHPKEKVVVARDSSELAGLVGEYALDVGAPKPLPATVTIEDGRLMLDVPTGSIGKVELLADSDSTFFTRSAGLPIAFGRDRTGRVIEIVVAGSARGKRQVGESAKERAIS